MLILQQLDLMYYVITSDVSNARACWAPLKRRSPPYGEKSWIFSSNWFLFNWRKKDMNFLGNFYSGSEPIRYVCRRDSGAASVRLDHVDPSMCSIQTIEPSVKQPKSLACRRTTWAGTGVQLWGGWVCPRTASVFEWPRCPAKRPTAPRSSAAEGWPWNPARGVELRPLHTGTPTRPAPARHHQHVRTSAQCIV